MPACGRAASVFSTLTDRAERVRLPPDASGRPVSGAVGGARVVVVAAEVVVVAFTCFFFSSPLAPLQAASTVASATARARAAQPRRVIPFTQAPALLRPDRRTRAHTLGSSRPRIGAHRGTGAGRHI